jgi:hypothetical protein
MARLRIKKVGIQKNVEDCAPNELIFDSNLNTLKDAYSGMIKKTITVFTQNVVIFNHNLGYVPNFKMYYDHNDGKFYDACGAMQYYAGSPYDALSVISADTTNLYASFPPSNYNSGTYNIKYFIFRNPS